MKWIQIWKMFKSGCGKYRNIQLKHRILIHENIVSLHNAQTMVKLCGVLHSGPVGRGGRSQLTFLNFSCLLVLHITLPMHGKEMQTCIVSKCFFFYIWCSRYIQIFVCEVDFMFVTLHLWVHKTSMNKSLL